MEIDDALMDAHLEPVPRLGALSARRLPRGDPEGARWHAHGTLGLQRLLLGAPDKIGTHLLQRFDVARRQRDADAVDRGLLGAGLLVFVGGLKEEHQVSS